MELKAKLHNRFDFEIYDTVTGKTEYAQAENIVLNNMYDVSYLGTIGAISVGTGTGTLSPTRTTLFSHLLSKTSAVVETVFDTPLTAHKTVKSVFSETEANGVWTEVGITRVSTTIKTHAFITDSEGNPITINKTNTKIITVYATLFAELLPATLGDYLDLGSNNEILNCLIGGLVSWSYTVSTLLKLRLTN